MGNRAYVSFGNYCGFEANNCLPVNWLALFDSEEFFTEKCFEEIMDNGDDNIIVQNKGLIIPFLAISRFFSKPAKTPKIQPEEYLKVEYRTSQPKALERVKTNISKLKSCSPIWSFFRPLEILRDELSLCPENETITLDLTPFMEFDDEYKQTIKEAVLKFSMMLNQFDGNKEHDLDLLNRLINEFSIGNISSIANLTPEERMFVLIGIYSGNEERENLYSLSYFDEAYWERL